jgi:hypothetical protein
MQKIHLKTLSIHAAKPLLSALAQLSLFSYSAVYLATFSLFGMNINGTIDAVLIYEKSALFLCSIGLNVIAIEKLYSFIKQIEKRQN